MDTTAQALARFQKLSYPYWKLYQVGKNVPFVTRTLEGDKFQDSYEQLVETLEHLDNGAYMLRVRSKFEDSGDKARVEIPFVKSNLVSNTSTRTDEASIRAQIEAEIRKEMADKARWEALEARIQALEDWSAAAEAVDRKIEDSIDQVTKVVATIPKLKSSFASLRNAANQ